MTTQIVMVTSDQNGFGTLGNEKFLDIDKKETIPRSEMSSDVFRASFWMLPARLSLILIRSALNSTKTQVENFFRLKRGFDSNSKIQWSLSVVSACTYL